MGRKWRRAIFVPLLIAGVAGCGVDENAPGELPHLDLQRSDGEADERKTEIPTGDTVAPEQ